MATSTAQEYETQTDKTEPADYFSDEDDLKEKGISLPPTREDVQKLLEVYDGKYAEELCFIRANYDAKKDQRQKSLKIKYKETETIMFKEFHLYKLKSTKGQPFTNSRGHYLGHIPGDKETQTRRADKIRKQIKRRLESDPLLNIAAAHVVVAPAINYGNEDDEAAAGSSGTAVSQTPNTRIQQKLTDLWSTPASDQGYGSMLVTPTYVQNANLNVAIEAFNHWVTMRLSKFRTMGAPGSGKTSVLDLTMGKPPATERESTDCIEPPTCMVVSEPPHAREVTIAPILAHEMVWEEVTRDRMYEMVGKALKARIDLLESQDVSPEALSPPRKKAKPDADVRSANDTDDMAHEMIHSSAKEQKPLQVTTAMIDQLEKTEGSMELMDVHWVFTQDTGGQPCYQSVAPLLLRENSCSVIATKLNEEFESKPEFAFFIKGKCIEMSSTKIQLTNLQMIETLVKSQASINPSLSSSKAPKYIIVGTFEDKANKCGETIETKNATLKERLYGLEDQRIDNGDSIIFPIYAVNPNVEERRKSAAWLRRKILESPGATVSERVNIRWFGLLLHLITEEKDIYTLDECLEAGKTLKMNEHEIFQALKFFHGLGIIIHFRTKDLEGVVVVKIEVIFGTLSLLLGISFIDRDTLDHEFKLNLMPKTQERLQLYGRFNKELLLQPQFKFSDVFTAKYFLDLLEHVTAIAAVGKDEYFLPSALAFATDEDIKLRVKGEPWIIRLTREEESTEPVDIPPPLAYLPSLVINVLKSSSAKLPSSKSRFSQQYSNALSLSYSGGVLHFIQRVDQIEVYFSLCEDQPRECHIIRSVVLAATETTEEKLNIPPGVLIKYDTFLCLCDEGSSGHVYTYNRDMKKAQCEKSEEYHELTLSQQRWLDGAQAGDSKLPSQEPTSVSVFKPNKPVTLSSPAAQRGEGKQDECAFHQILTSDDLLDVLEQLKTLRRDKFWNLGLKLGLLDSTLDNLSDDSPKTFGRTVMQAWLNQEDNVKDPSWKSLVEALESDYVMERPTAQNVLDWLKSR